jgi:hypothetical protein
MSGGIGNFIVTLPENMYISSDDEDFILANLELFELQPIEASSVGEYEQMQRHLQADNPTHVIRHLVFCLVAFDWP